MKSVFRTGIIVTLLLSLIVIPVHAESGKHKVYLNGELLENIEIVIDDGMSFVPFRYLFEKLGLKVDYKQETGEVLGSNDKVSLHLQIGSARAYVNGEEITIAKPVKRIDGRAYVPLRFVSEYSGFDVGYMAESKEIFISNKLNKETIEDDLRTVLTHFLAESKNHIIPDLFTASLTSSDDMIDINFYMKMKYLNFIPLEQFSLDIYEIFLLRDDVAEVYAHYYSKSAVVEQSEDFAFTLVFENGRWRILGYKSENREINLTETYGNVVNAIKSTSLSEAEQVLTDIQTYYEAANAGDVETTYQYTSPFHMEDRQARYRLLSYKDGLEIAFRNSGHNKKKLLKAEVIFLDKSQAVVYTSQQITSEFDGKTMEEEKLVTMDKIDTRWTFYSETTFVQD